MAENTQYFRVPQVITDKLESVRERAWKVRFLAALIGGLVVLLAAMGLAMLIDRWATIYSPFWRTLLTLLAISVTGLSVVAWIVAAKRYVNRIERVAADVDRAVPQLEERLSTISQLSTPEQTRDVHPAMFRRVAEEARNFSPHVDPQVVVQPTRILRAAWALTGIAAILVLAVVLDHHRTFVLVKRFWMPLANISATEIHPVKSEGVVARGESLEIDAEIKGIPVDEATLFMDAEEKDEQSITLIPRGDNQERVTHRVRSVTEPFRYRLRAGDGQTDWQEVAVADRPELAATKVVVTPPAYTEQPAQTFDKLPRRLSVLAGSEVEFSFKPRSPVSKLYLDMGGKSEQALIMDADGWYRWQVKVTENLTLSPVMVEAHGLTNRRPPICNIQARPDKPPVVRILTPNEEMAVQPNEKVPVSFVAKDDVRVGSAELVVYDDRGNKGEPRVLDTIPIPLGDQEGAKEVKGTAVLDLSRYKMQDGSQLSFAVRVTENRSAKVDTSVQQSADSQAAPAETFAQTQQEPVNIDPNVGGAEQMSKPGDDKTVPTPTNNQQLASNAPTEGTVNQSPSMESTNADPDSIANQTLTQQQQPENVSEGPAAAQGDQKSATAPDVSEPSSLASNQPSGASQQPNDGALENRQTETTSDRQQITTASQDEPSANNPESPANAAALQGSQMAGDQPANNQSGGESQADPSSMTAQGSQQPRQQSNSPSNMGTQTAQETGNQDARPSGEDSMLQPNNNAMAQAGNQNSQPQSQPQGDQPQQQNMAERGSQPPQNNQTAQLDVPQSQTSTSNRMRLTVDQWAGSFAGQERTQVEMAIAPELLKLDELLESAESMSRSVLDVVDANNGWTSAQGRDIDNAGQKIAAALQVVEDLEQRTHGTPYAFVGLQLTNIAKSHIQPARREFWKSLQTGGDARVTATRNGWQHTVRSREMLAELTTRFETTRQEYALADSIEKVKKMYQIFVENSMALLSNNGDEGSRYSRKRVEFDLDEEYLARLKEVLEMRNNMREELAKILADDPRLLRRFLDAQQNRRHILRHELEEMIESQRELNREVVAWSNADESVKPTLQAMMVQRHAETAADLAVDASVLQDRFETWLPLTQEVSRGDVQAAMRLLQEIATATQELSTDAEAYIAQNQQAEVVADTESEPVEADSEPAVAPIEVEELSSDAQTLHTKLTNLEVALRQFGTQDANADLAVFAANRLLETRKLISLSGEWIRQLKHHQEGNYQNAAEVEQYRLAMQTDAMAGKLADLEQQMAALLQRADNKIPESIANKSRELLASLDEQAAPNQLSAVYALRRNQLDRAIERQTSAVQAIEKAGKDYDELIEMAIKELDKLPVQDPIASLLQDPTLDELLAELEQEIPIQELLGIPNRPSNLQIAEDFVRMGGDNSVATASNQRMLMNQMLQQQRMRQRRLDRAYRRAIARALKETVNPENSEEDNLEVAQETVEWNVLLSKLGDDLKQDADKAPPERYRKAIEQYFQQVSGSDKANNN